MDSSRNSSRWLLLLLAGVIAAVVYLSMVSLAAIQFGGEEPARKTAPPKPFVPPPAKSPRAVPAPPPTDVRPLTPPSLPIPDLPRQ